jgi:hypothetical protein
MTKRRLVLLGLAVVLAVAFFLSRTGLRVAVTNTGAAPMRAVVVHVTGASYDLGDIPPGSSREVSIEPTGPSHVELSFKDDQGRQLRLVTGANFEPSAHGSIEIAVRDGTIQRFQDHTRTGPF